MPAHPAYVHFPIVFFSLATFFLFVHLLDGEHQRINRFSKKLRLGSYDFEAISFLSLLLGFITGFISILSGLKLVNGWNHVPVPHGFLGLATELCYFVVLIMRWVFGTSVHVRPFKTFYYVLHILGLGLLIWTGYEGGELHYK